jgi:hypothetical protein
MYTTSYSSLHMLEHTHFDQDKSSLEAAWPVSTRLSRLFSVLYSPKLIRMSSRHPAQAGWRKDETDETHLTCAKLSKIGKPRRSGLQGGNRRDVRWDVMDSTR